MTTLCIDDASERLRTELRGHTATTDDDTPAPIYIERLRAATRDLADHTTEMPE